MTLRYALSFADKVNFRFLTEVHFFFFMDCVYFDHGCRFYIGVSTSKIILRAKIIWYQKTFQTKVCTFYIRSIYMLHFKR